MKDGIIELDSARGKVLGFTSDRLDGYLWKAGNSVYVSFVVSKEKGSFRVLVARIHERGLTVKVPTPLGRMKSILRRNGYRHTIERDENSGERVDVWVLPPPFRP